MRARMRVRSGASVTAAAVMVLYLSAMIKARQREDAPNACLGGGGCKAPSWFKPSDPAPKNESDDGQKKQWELKAAANW